MLPRLSAANHLHYRTPDRLPLPFIAPNRVACGVSSLCVSGLAGFLGEWLNWILYHIIVHYSILY